ncbi:MAG: NAD(P)-dependent oxidoreductase, partial [Spirochaetia bacterium]|nr:NAD(P)-dependent oxidoreductase [Spirochaetia bacterium]
GIPDDLYFKVLEKNAAYSPLAKLKEPKLKAADYAPQFSIKHMWKDMRLALGTRNEKLFPLTDAVEKRFALASEKGFADLDYSALIRLL